MQHAQIRGEAEAVACFGCVSMGTVIVVPDAEKIISLFAVDLAHLFCIPVCLPGKVAIHQAVHHNDLALNVAILYGSATAGCELIGNHRTLRQALVSVLIPCVEGGILWYLMTMIEADGDVIAIGQQNFIPRSEEPEHILCFICTIGHARDHTVFFHTTQSQTFALGCACLEDHIDPRQVIAAGDTGQFEVTVTAVDEHLLPGGVCAIAIINGTCRQ